ncbi:MAG: hypothetical protein HY678_08690 [Chloroflexi bacterium]|nr:hypothetical protein [Chloroflexota bacterium]
MPEYLDPATHTYDALEYASHCQAKGFALVPVGGDGELVALLGSSSGGLVIVELADPIALALSDHLLPPTGLMFGRDGPPRSSRVYRVSDAPPDTVAYGDPKAADPGRVVVRLIGEAGQAALPGLPGGRSLHWDRDGQPATLTGEALRTAVNRLMFASAVARRWPEHGARQEAALALSGALRRAGLGAAEAMRIIVEVATTAGDDDALIRTAAVEQTWAFPIDQFRSEWKRVGVVFDEWTREVGERLLGDAWPERRRNGPVIALNALIAQGQATGEPTQMHSDAFYGVAGDFIRAVSPETEADPAALLLTLIVFFGNVVGRGTYFLVEATKHYTNEYAVIIGQSSKARKGVTTAQVSALCRKAGTGMPQFERWLRERIHTGLSSAEGLILKVADADESEDDNPDPQDHVDREPADKRLMVDQSEFAGITKVIERAGNTLSPVLRDAWDGKRRL